MNYLDRNTLPFDYFFCHLRRIKRLVIGWLICQLFLPLHLSFAAELTKIENCEFVPTEWADGDSFRVKPPDAEEFTVRLYGVDCVELHVKDATDERRLREQRRHFGITGIEPDTRASIEVAKKFGKEAAEYVSSALAKPFTVYTAFADARGNGKYKRHYAFIVTSEGTDLGADLVSKGLARAFGVSRETFEGRSRDEYREYLEDLELKAASLKMGIWARTDWEGLPDERRSQREEDAEIALAIGNSPLPSDARIDPNTAARDELMRLPGIGEVIANRIIEDRPYEDPADLLRVPGIGKVTLERIFPFLVIGEKKDD